jgi:murein DD-endopeptidase MepM/ murein hydrolase activator NlpD
VRGAELGAGRAMRVCLLCLAAVAAFAACRGPRVIVLPPASRSARAEAPASPRTAYLDSLRAGKEEPGAAWAGWAAAGEEALASPLEVPLPFAETGEFPRETPAAVGYRMSLKPGQRVVVECAPAGASPFRLFVDVYILGGGKPRPVAAVSADAAGGARLVFDVLEEAVYLLRVQPEAWRGGRYVLSERVDAPYLVPVAGVDAATIADSFHDPRENGRRQHDGLDIFAPRGTPALAATAGVITRTATGGLGGNAVWLRDDVRGVTLYYAHLDKMVVRSEQAVKAGEPVGFVGNTGNAAGGPTHLHFGVYTSRGAVDPLPFIRPATAAAPGAPADLAALGEVRQVAAGGTWLMAKAGIETPDTPWLPAATLVTVEAAAGQLDRVRLPDGRAGFVLARALEVPPAKKETASSVIGQATRHSQPQHARGPLPASR